MRHPKHRAFTLVEMLVVIAIIGILASLITAAAFSARRVAKKAVIAVEINQLDMACKAFKAKFGDYPPDFADINRECALAQVKRFISRAFPRCKRLPTDFQGTELPPQYTAATALIFWLGGIVDDTRECIGFSADPTNPFDVDFTGNLLPDFDSDNPAAPHKCTSRIQPFNEFDRIKRIAPDNSRPNLFGYWPSSVTPDVSRYTAGYVYFRPENKSYGPQSYIDQATGNTITISGGKALQLIGRGAVHDGRVAGTVWLNSNSFQIRCCGLDGRWWNTGDSTHWCTVFGIDPGPVEMHPENYDDMGNCWSGTLEDNL